MDGFRDILVHVDEGEAAPRFLRFSIDFAKSFNSALTGIYMKPEPLFPALTRLRLGPEILNTIQAGIDKREQKVRQSFETKLQGTGLDGYWLVGIGGRVEQICRYGRSRNLIILRQWHTQDRLEFDPEVVSRIILEAGRPVLVVPGHYSSSSPARRILLAWNNSRESARALHDAMPVLMRADKVDVVVVQDRDEPEESMQRAIAELTSCLMRHAVDAEIHIEVARQESSAEALGRLVGLLGSDMVVSGAWGHSRYFELISGGVTRHLMRYSSVPVFFSH